MALLLASCHFLHAIYVKSSARGVQHCTVHTSNIVAKVQMEIPLCLGEVVFVVSRMMRLSGRKGDGNSDPPGVGDFSDVTSSLLFFTYPILTQISPCPSQNRRTIHHEH